MKMIFKVVSSFQLHAVSRTQQGRQRETNIKTLRLPFFDDFWRHCLFSGGTQRRALPRRRGEEMKILLF